MMLSSGDNIGMFICENASCLCWLIGLDESQEKITSSLIGNLMGLNLIPNKIPTSVMVGKVRLFPMSFLLGIINSQFWKLV